jgi:hypothetical protein
MSPQAAAPRFLLSKWYLDCVSEQGDVFIGYAAVLHWRGFLVRHSSILRHQRDRNLTRNASARAYSPPEVAEGSIGWSSSELNVTGVWRSLSRPVERTIFTSKHGSVEWRCLQPGALAEIHVGADFAIRGLGYVECLTLSIPAWRLPIDELRWGRFLTESDALVWLDWRGPKPLTLVFYNGAQTACEKLTDDSVVLSGGDRALTLADRRVLRAGPLAETALAGMSRILKLLPFRILQTYEQKWCSRGTLTAPGQPARSGWAIHELVSWRNASESVKECQGRSGTCPTKLASC